jgi:hypothetical protein
MSDSDAGKSHRLPHPARIPETAEIGGIPTVPSGAQIYSARPEVLTRRRIGGLIWIIVAILLVAYGTFLVAENLSTSSTEASPHAERAYAAYTAVFAVATFAIATLALLISIPSFAIWINAQVRQVRVRTWIEVAQNTESLVKEATDGMCELSGRDFVLRLVIANIGSSPLQASMNIYVPAQCSIKALDDPSAHHVVGILPVESSSTAQSIIWEPESGDPPVWKYSASKLSVAPYYTANRHLAILTPGSGIYPIVATISTIDAQVRIKIKIQEVMKVSSP